MVLGVGLGWGHRASTGTHAGDNCDPIRIEDVRHAGHRAEELAEGVRWQYAQQ